VDEVVRGLSAFAHLIGNHSVLHFMFESSVFDEMLCVCRALTKQGTASSVQSSCARFMRVLINSIQVSCKQIVIYIFC
jgi:hypothetical protein